LTKLAQFMGQEICPEEVTHAGNLPIEPTFSDLALPLQQTFNL
jgi:hypothetical protein